LYFPTALSLTAQELIEVLAIEGEAGRGKSKRYLVLWGPLETWPRMTKDPTKPGEDANDNPTWQFERNLLETISKKALKEFVDEFQKKTT
jgi:hypothetical protein